MYSEVISPALAAPPPLPTYPQVSERQGRVGLFQGNPQNPSEERAWMPHPSGRSLRLRKAARGKGSVISESPARSSPAEAHARTHLPNFTVAFREVKLLFIIRGAFTHFYGLLWSECIFLSPLYKISVF